MRGGSRQHEIRYVASALRRATVVHGTLVLAALHSSLQVEQQIEVELWGEWSSQDGPLDGQIVGLKQLRNLVVLVEKVSVVDHCGSFKSWDFLWDLILLQVSRDELRCDR